MRRQAEWAGTPSINGSTQSARLMLLTISSLGLTITWSLEQTYCTPYLLSLGLTKARTSLVWIAGPLSGLCMQPVVGAISDRSTSKFGRRRPFILAGSLVTSICLIFLGWAKEIVGLFLSDDSAYQKNVTILVAILSIYGLDFAINVVQACGRSLIVDVLSISEQQIGSAWAVRMAACGNIVGFLVGTLDLVAILPSWLGGDTQFKKMILMANLGLWITVGLTCWAVKERVLLKSGDDNRSMSELAVNLWKRMWNLPHRIQMICWCQFWAWIGWFPFLFYSSTWVGEMYYRHERPSSPSGQGDDHDDTLANIGRLGSFSLLLFSIVTFASSVWLPYLVRKPEDEVRSSNQGRFTPRPPPGLARNIQVILTRLYEQPKPELIRVWALSSLGFAGIMFWAPFVSSLSFATTIVALCGISWAVSCWAPFAEMGVEINKLSNGGNNHSSIREAQMGRDPYTPLRPLHDDDEDDVEIVGVPDTSRPRSSSAGVLYLTQSNEDVSSSTGELAGVYLGVLNVYTTLPQFVGTLVSWLVFSIFEPARDTDGPEHRKYLDVQGINAISVCLFIGAVCAVVAAECTRRLEKLS